MSLRSSIRLVPNAKARVNTTGRPSGMAATARATADTKVSSSVKPLTVRWSTTITAIRAATMEVMRLPRVSISR